MNLLSDAFKKDVTSELPANDLAQDAVVIEWGKLLNTSQHAPSLSCAGESFHWVSDTVYAYRQDPRSGNYKAKIGMDFLWSGGINAGNSSSSDSGSNNSSGNGTTTVQRINTWIKHYGDHSYRLRKSLGARVRQQGRSSGDIPATGNDSNKITLINTTKSSRAQQLIMRLELVMNGSIQCNFRGLTFAIEKPSLRIGRISSLYNNQNTSISATSAYSSVDRAASCLIALIPYLVSDSSVFYLEEFPRVEITDVVANGILESGEIIL